MKKQLLTTTALVAAGAVGAVAVAGSAYAQKGKKPFFAYISTNAPHGPFIAPDSYKKRYLDAELPLPEAYRPEHPFDNGMLKIRDEKLAKFPRSKEEIRKHVAAAHGA